MAEDLINNKDIYFPSYLGTNDKLITLLNRTSQTLCNWFSSADKNGPLPLDERGRCIGRGVNRRNINKDPLGHAEIMALRQASLIKNDWRFNECTIITNLEPCTMCSSALIQARMGKVIFGAYDKKRGGLGGSIDLSKHESAHHKMEIIGGILEDECSQILKIWFKKLRTQK